MKYIISAIILLGLFLSLPQFASAQSFDHTNHDFGTISESGGVVKYEFTFKNMGAKPIVISETKVNCTCTKTIYSRKPVLSGQSGIIEVTFNPRRQNGSFMKAITVIIDGNGAPKRQILTIHGVVK